MSTKIIIVPFDICGLHINISAPSKEAASILLDNLDGVVATTPIRTIDTGFDVVRHPGFKQFRQDTIVQFLYKVGQMNRVNTPLLLLRDAILAKLTNYEYSMGLVAAYKSTERFDLRHIGTSFSDHHDMQTSSDEISALQSPRTIPSDGSTSFFYKFEEWINAVVSGLASYGGKYRKYSTRLTYISQGNLSNNEIGQRSGVTRERIRQEKVKFVSCFREFRLPKVLENELLINESFKQDVMNVKTMILGFSVEEVMADFGEIEYGKLSFILECMGLQIKQNEQGTFVAPASSVTKIPQESKYQMESVSVYEACVA